MENRRQNLPACSPVQKDGWIQGCSHARRPYPASGKKFARVALSLHYHRWCITVESRSPSGITTCMETRGIIEASSHLATVWLIDVVANKFGVIGWRVYRHVAADFSPLGSPSSVRAQFLWKLIGSKISRTVSRDRWTGYVSNCAPIFTVCLYLVSFPLKNRPISSYFFFLTTTTSNYPYEKRCQSRTNESIITMKENGSRDTAFQRLWRTAESKEARRKKDRSGGKNMGIGGQDISEDPVPRTWWSSSPPPPPRRRLQNGKKRGRTKTVARRIDAAAGIPRNDICSPLFRVLCHEGTTSFCPWFSASLLFSIARR